MLAVLAVLLAGCSESAPAVPFDPTAAEHQLPAVAAALRMGEPERALAELDRAAAAGTLPDGALYLRGVALRDAGRAGEARAALEAELTAHPGDGHAHAQLAGLLIGEGRLADAAAHLERARELAPGAAPVLLSSARLALRQGDSELALRLYRDHLARDPYGRDAIEAHAALAEIAAARGPAGLEEAGAHARASDHLRQVHEHLGGYAERLRADPRDAEAAHGVAVAWLSLYVALGPDPLLLRQAEQAVDVALASHPDDARALASLGFIRSEQRRYDEAIDLLRRAIALDDGESAAHVNLGGLLLRTGQPDEALAQFERGLQAARTPDEELHARLELVRCLASRPTPDDWRRAIAEAQPLLARDPDGRLGVEATLQEVQRRLDAATRGPAGAVPTVPAAPAAPRAEAEPARPPDGS